MDTADRRMEIVSILMVRHHTTAGELAEELGVSVRTIHNDIRALSYGYPIYTRQGENGGVFMRDGYRPYGNTLTRMELKVLCDLYRMAGGEYRKILSQVIRKYGPDKLEL